MMIDFYTAATANGHRAAIALEECGHPYRVHKLNLQAGDQKKPEYLAINPAGVIPAIVDQDGPGRKPLALAQSGAILLYLAEKTGRLLPEEPARRAQALQWVMHACTDCAVTSGAIFQLSNVSPEKSPANIAFLEQRLLSLLAVCEQRLAGRDYLTDEYSAADVALYPVVNARKALMDKAGSYPNLTAWWTRVGSRPAVARGMQVSA